MGIVFSRSYAECRTWTTSKDVHVTLQSDTMIYIEMIIINGYEIIYKKKIHAYLDHIRKFKDIKQLSFYEIYN